MNKLDRKAFGGLLNLMVVLALSIFLPAWTLKYWQGWVFLLVFCASSLAITLYLMKNDPKLLERRVKGGTVAEKERNQKVIQALASAAFVATIVIPVLDHRFRLTGVPVFVVCFGDSLVVLGFVIVFLVFKENTFTSGVIEVADGQKVISTGPYAIVRHPMYVGALVLLLGAPLALGSWRGLFTIIPMTIVIILRLLNEERFLAKNLPGYREYRTVVRYRLLPLIW